MRFVTISLLSRSSRVTLTVCFGGCVQVTMCVIHNTDRSMIDRPVVRLHASLIVDWFSLWNEVILFLLDRVINSLFSA